MGRKWRFLLIGVPLVLLFIAYVRYRIWEVRIVIPVEESANKQEYLWIGNPYPLHILAESMRHYSHAQRYVVAWKSGFQHEAYLLYVPENHYFEANSGCQNGSCPIDVGPLRFVDRDDILSVANRGKGAFEVKSH